ncbi:hypothetical protein ACTFJW_04120 [Clostridium cagae]|uniref:hypothetical protein n=1 Tax=Clostridium cagae TaxID=2080751 RepID=UPI003F766E16
MAYDAEIKNKIVLGIVNEGKKISDYTINNDAPKEQTIRKWIKEYEYTGKLFKDDNNNDAIPSWSGYSYQGKIAILCTLQKINELYESGNEIEINNWKIQLEKLQDFVFIHNGTSRVLWQVKATLSKTKYARYEEALKKLMEDKSACGNINAKCILVSAIEIDDWDEQDNTYNTEIDLYQYNNDSVSIDKVCKCIKQEINKIFNFIQISLDLETTYLVLCSLIDEKVFEFHKQGKGSSYEIGFDEFLERINNTNKLEDRIGLLKLKEKLYENIMRSINQGIEIYCDENCEQCNNEQCGVLVNSCLLQKIDISEYIKSIKPDIDSTILLNYNISEPEEYTDRICSVMKASESNAICTENNIIYIVCSSGNLKVIPTLLNLNNGKEIRISKKLDMIGKNEWLQERIGEKILVGETNNNIFRTQLDKFTNINLQDLIIDETTSNERKIGIKYIFDDIQEKLKATKFKRDIIVVNKDDLIKYFEEIGNNVRYNI